ncbi:rCG58823, partial [Rattus norvegicus]
MRNHAVDKPQLYCSDFFQHSSTAVLEQFSEQYIKSN